MPRRYESRRQYVRTRRDRPSWARTTNSRARNIFITEKGYQILEQIEAGTYQTDNRRSSRRKINGKS